MFPDKRQCYSGKKPNTIEMAITNLGFGKRSSDSSMTLGSIRIVIWFTFAKSLNLVMD